MGRGGRTLDRQAMDLGSTSSRDRQKPPVNGEGGSDDDGSCVSRSGHVRGQLSGAERGIPGSADGAPYSDRPEPVEAANERRAWTPPRRRGDSHAPREEMRGTRGTRGTGSGSQVEVATCKWARGGRRGLTANQRVAVLWNYRIGQLWRPASQSSACRTAWAPLCLCAARVNLVDLVNHQRHRHLSRPPLLLSAASGEDYWP